MEHLIWGGTRLFIFTRLPVALAGLAQWIDGWTGKQRVASWIPSQGPGLQGQSPVRGL